MGVSTRVVPFPNRASLTNQERFLSRLDDFADLLNSINSIHSVTLDRTYATGERLTAKFVGDNYNEIFLFANTSMSSTWYWEIRNINGNPRSIVNFLGLNSSINFYICEFDEGFFISDSMSNHNRMAYFKNLAGEIWVAINPFSSIYHKNSITNMTSMNAFNDLKNQCFLLDLYLPIEGQRSIHKFEKLKHAIFSDSFPVGAIFSINGKNYMSIASASSLHNNHFLAEM